MGARFASLVAGVGLLAPPCHPAAAPPAPTAPPPTVAPSPTQAAATPTQVPAAKPTTGATAATALHVSYSNVIADNLPEGMDLQGGYFQPTTNPIQLAKIASSP